MTIFEEINQLEILNVLDVFGVRYAKDSGQPHSYTLLKDNWVKDNSFKINTAKNIGVNFGGDWEKWWPFDLIARLVLWVDPQTNIWKVATIKAFVDKWLVQNPQTKKDFIKSKSGEELLKDFNEHKLGGFSNAVSSFLITRGFSHTYITKNQLKIWEVFANIWYYDNYFTTEKATWKDEEGKWQYEEWDKPKTVGVFMFPCLDEYWEIIGLKLRRKDWKAIRGKKSLAVWKTWLWYTDLDLSKMIIVEGETDALVLMILGYKNIVANLGWVQSNRQRLKSFLFDVAMIVCIYDIDVAGTNAKKELADIFWRQIHEVVFPIRENNKWVILSDVNDFYNTGYDTKTKWDKLLLETKVIGEEQAKQWKYPFIVLRKHLKYYDIEYHKLYDKWPIADHLGIKPADLVSMRKDGSIQTYEDLCYLEGWKPSHYNTLDMATIIKSGGEASPVIHSHIAHLIHSIWWGKKKNIEWIHKSILFKLTHLNNVHVPALVLYGTWWSWKGTFINLLSKIFWEENTLKNLKQRDLENNFDSYQGQKLIVEFQEVSSGNKFNDKKILDRIKSMIGEARITINAKFENTREIDNIARFHLSSNHAVPIQMDSKHSWNRRFTIIKTWNALDSDIAWEMNNKTFLDRQVIREYVNWLYMTYPEVPDMETFPALDNEEKQNLEEVCEGAANQFFEWLEQKYPQITRISTPQRNILLNLYCAETWEDPFDIKFKPSNFDLWLSHRYEKKAVRIWDKTVRGYFIKKTKFELDWIPETVKQYFSNDNQLI